MAKQSVSTLRPVNAAKVSGRTNSCAAARHHHLDLVAVLHQQARELRGLVGRDAATNSQETFIRSLEDLVSARAVPSGRRAGEAVLHQSAAHLFHGDDRGLLRGSRQHRTRSALQLPRPLGGDDDKPVGALLRIVRKSAMCVISGVLSAMSSLPLQT